MPVPAALLAAAAGGLGLDGAFPALGWWPLAFVSVLLALLSLQGRTIPESVLVGAAFGAAFYFPHVTWAASFLGDHPLAWVPWIALAAAETLLLAALSPLITLAYRWFPPSGSALSGSSLALSALVAGAWMTRKLVLSSWPYGGFPWGRLAMTQSESPFAEAASWVGVAGLGFLMVLLCALALQVGRVLWQGRRGRTGAEQRRRWPARLPWSVIAPATLVILLALIPQYPTQPAGSLRIGAVQGNGPAAYADARNPGDVFNAQLSASRPLADEDVDLVLWPEGGVDCDPLADPGAALRLNAAARAYGAPILVNSAVETSDGIVNQSLLWTAEGPTASHGKRHPVPFGEYVPDRWLYEKIAPGLVGLLQREYVPGDDAPRIETGGVAAGLAICFDVAFDDVIAESVLGGSQVHLFQTNNADFRGTDEHLQQLAFARMRAIETGRSVVNLSTTGSSQVFDPAGNTLAEVPPGRPGVLVAEVDLRDGRTPGVVLGASIRRVIFWGTLASLALVGVLNSRRRPPRVGQQLGQGLLR